MLGPARESRRAVDVRGNGGPGIGTSQALERRALRGGPSLESPQPPRVVEPQSSSCRGLQIPQAAVHVVLRGRM